VTAMGLNVRLPLGFLFVTLGGLLAVFGASSDRAIHARSFNIDVNLIWGVVILLFGAVLLWLTRWRSLNASESSSAATERGSSRAGL
jgi:hypothetical protein